MGFMRKALFVGTGGASGMAGVKANSKKDRTAKATEKQLRLQKQMLTQQPAGQATPQATATVPRIGMQEGWLNEVAAKLTGLGLTEVERNTGNVLAGIPIEGGSTLEGPGLRVSVTLFMSTERAHQAELGLTAKPDVRDAMSKGLSAVKRQDRVLFLANAGHPGKKVDVSRLDGVIDALAAINLPAPQLDTNAPPQDGGQRAPSAIADEIERLAQLHAQGTLTNGEFVAAKSKLLGA
jgi:hypothetical protein